MSPTMTRSPWSTDLTLLCERLAERLRHEGAGEPLVAAVALVVRGRRAVGRERWADELGLDVETVAAVEEGHVGWDDVPTELHRAAARCEGLDLPRLGLAPDG